MTSSDPLWHFKSTQAWNGVVGPGALPPTLQLSVKLPVQNPDCGKTGTAKWFLPGFQPSEAARLQVSLMFINLYQCCMQMSIVFYPLVLHPFIHSSIHPFASGPRPVLGSSLACFLQIHRLLCSTRGLTHTHQESHSLGNRFQNTSNGVLARLARGFKVRIDDHVNAGLPRGS